MTLGMLAVKKSHAPGLHICSMTTCPLLMSITSSDRASWDLNKSGQQESATSEYQEMDILQFSDIICKKLKPRNWRLPHMLKPGQPLERISHNDGDTQYKLTNRQYNKGCNVGKSIQQNCFVCQKYLKSNGDTLYNQASFRCSLCKMPLCKKDRTDLSTGHLTSCLKGFQESNY
jgi:hypothetical protein